MKRLEEIRKFVEDTLSGWMAEPESRPSGPVNWEDISVKNVLMVTEEYENGQKEFYIKVVLSEADPEANHFKQALTNALDKAGYIDVIVETEW